jgi:hypothetical protein
MSARGQGDEVFSPSERERRIVADLRSRAEAALRYWDNTPGNSAASKQVLTAIETLSAALAGSDASVIRASRGLVTAAQPGIRASRPWATKPLRALIDGMYSALRKLGRSPSAQTVLDLCDEVRQLWAALGEPAEGSPEHLRALAGLMVLEDSVSAIEGYGAIEAFDFTDHAYLAKYGLLQAMQLAFDSVQAVAGALGMKLRPDRLPGGKVVMVTRNLVAGHPVGGTYQGSAYQHFHDRGSVQDPDVIRVMSFQQDEPEEWTGQTQLTADLIANTYAVVTASLNRVCGHLRTTHCDS